MGVCGQVEVEDIIACSMHGEHNLLALTWYATISLNLWDKKVTDKVNEIVTEDWHMKHHKIKKQSGKEAIKKNSPHFNGPEGKIACARRQEVLDVVFPGTGPSAGKKAAERELAMALWAAQDDLFAIWRAPISDKSDWLDMGDKAQAAAEAYRSCFLLLCSADDATPTLHYALHHWPQHIRDHGSLAATNAQGLEAGNKQSKRDLRDHCNKQQKRKLEHGGWTRGRAAQGLARHLVRAYNFVLHGSLKVQRRHVAKPKGLPASS